MKTTLALFLAAGLTTVSLAFEPDPATKQNPAPPPAPSAPAAPAQPEAKPTNGPSNAEIEAAKAKFQAEFAAKVKEMEAAKPKGVPVPDMPAINKQELEGGLIIEDLKIGEGAEVKDNGVVVAFYHGTLKADGKVFDSAFQRGEPTAFPLAGVIPGWQKGVPGMKNGGIRKLTIPYALAYGEQDKADQQGNVIIPGKSDLVFIVQLVDQLVFEDVKVGEGEAVGQQAVVVCNTTATTTDNKAWDGWPESKTYIWLPGENMGMQFAFANMKVGGKRKVHLPRQMGVTISGLPSKFGSCDERSAQMPGAAGKFGFPDMKSAKDLNIEIEVVAVRNIGQ